MRPCPPLILAAACLGLAACASEPAKPPGVFDLSNGLDRPAPWSKDATSATGASEVGPMGAPAPGGIDRSIGAPAPGQTNGINMLGN